MEMTIINEVKTSFDENLKQNQSIGQKKIKLKSLGYIKTKLQRANNHRNNVRLFFSGSERKPIQLNNIRGEMSHLPGQMKRLPLK